MRHSSSKASLHMQKDSPNAACLAIFGVNIKFTTRSPVQNPESSRVLKSRDLSTNHARFKVRL